MKQYAGISGILLAGNISAQIGTCTEECGDTDFNSEYFVNDSDIEMSRPRGFEYLINADIHDTINGRYKAVYRGKSKLWRNRPYGKVFESIK